MQTTVQQKKKKKIFGRYFEDVEEAFLTAQHAAKVQKGLSQFIPLVLNTLLLKLTYKRASVSCMWKKESR